MVEVRRKFDDDFKIGVVRIVRESGNPIALVARELGVNEGSWATGARGIGALEVRRRGR